MKQLKDYSKTMIVRVDAPGLQYDISAILKAFYPDREIRVLEPDSVVHDRDILTLPVYMDVHIPRESADKPNEVRLFGKAEEVPKDMPFFGVTADTSKADRGDDITADRPRDDGADTKKNGQSGVTQDERRSGLVCVDGREYRFDIDEDIGAKNSFKLSLYDIMCKITDQTLPWGNLTGVRPTKIAMTKMREGADDGTILEYMKNHHRVSDEKARLALDIAHREDTLLSQIDHRHGYSLYIDIPFCPTRCLYCSFTAYPYAAWRDRINEYLEALYKEIDYVADEIQNSRGIAETDGLGVKGSPDTIYIGGGTPTSLDEEHFEKLLQYLTDRIDMTGTIEFTCEAGRPDSITEDKLKLMKAYGVSRISINPQTMQPKTLDIIGRLTTPGQVINAYAKSRAVGFDNINMDIILGLPGEGVCEVSDTLRQIDEMKPDSLTVHSLAVKRASRLKERLDEIGIGALINTEETMRLASEAATRMGMKPYYLYRQKNMSGNFENTGYAVPGKEGIYNILIMEEVQSIVALGAGAISKRVKPDNIFRAENPKDIDNYISRIDELIDRKRKLFG